MWDSTTMGLMLTTVNANHKKWNDKLIDSVSPLNKENILKYQILLEKLGVKQ